MKHHVRVAEQSQAGEALVRDGSIESGSSENGADTIVDTVLVALAEVRRTVGNWTVRAGRHEEWWSLMSSCQLLVTLLYCSHTVEVSVFTGGNSCGVAMEAESARLW